jgi:hypothetical protein
MPTTHVHVRIAGADDQDPLRAAFPDSPLASKLLAGDAGKFLVLLARDEHNTVVGALAVDLGGKTTRPDEPDIFRIELADHAGPEGGPVWKALHEKTIETLAEMEHKGVGVCVGATDAEGVKRYESLGFRPDPSGGPYKPLGPGMVEYLQGYADPVGYVIDMRRDL